MSGNRNRIVASLMLLAALALQALALSELAGRGLLASGSVVTAYAQGDLAGVLRALFADPYLLPVALLLLGPLLVWVVAMTMRPHAAAGSQAAADPQASTSDVADAADAAPQPDPDGVALRLLAVLQEEARLLDFVGEDIDNYSDAEVGAAARGIHQSLRKALAERLELRAIREEEEGASVDLGGDIDPAALRVIGAAGEVPANGTLVHAGWYANAVRLPRPTAGSDARILAPAEVEVGGE